MISDYPIYEFYKDFPDDNTCLEYIFKKRYPDLTGYYRIKNRKAYVNKAGHQIYPLVGIIFEKTTTPLSKWFRAIYLFAHYPEISAMYLSRELDVTYKCAWRIRSKIHEIAGGQFTGNPGKLE